MGDNVCSAAGCFLQREGGLVSFPLVTIAGLVDGINPCAIGMILLLLGYLLIFAKKPEKVLPLGLVYIGTVYLTYLGIGFFFWKISGFLQLQEWGEIFKKGLGGALLLAGIVNIKDFFAPQLPLHLQIPDQVRPKLLALVEKTSFPAVVLLAFLVTLLETPCSLPVYVGTVTILAQAGLPIWQVVGYFLYYNLLFVLPLIVILIITWKGKQIVELKEWEHKYKKTMKLSLGVLLVAMAAYILIF